MPAHQDQHKKTIHVPLQFFELMPANHLLPNIHFALPSFRTSFVAAHQFQHRRKISFLSKVTFLILLAHRFLQWVHFVFPNGDNDAEAAAESDVEAETAAPQELPNLMHPSAWVHMGGFAVEDEVNAEDAEVAVEVVADVEVAAEQELGVEPEVAEEGLRFSGQWRGVNRRTPKTK